ncbi:MAG: (deoxy)nucleoside triphosphate pyrophosphohydrolase [Propionibacterium sp.]|nr:(deoxy)nucleoside triphosphate pyrophosphohydrolase [Propionibacterium sp.]
MVVAGIVVSKGRVLVARRSYPPEIAGSWEFPGGKVEPGESADSALARELHEELGITVQVDAEFESTSGPWPLDAERVLHAFFATIVAGDPAPGHSHDEIRWVEPGSLTTLDLLPVDRAIAAALATG